MFWPGAAAVWSAELQLQLQLPPCLHSVGVENDLHARRFMLSMQDIFGNAELTLAWAMMIMAHGLCMHLATSSAYTWT